MLAGSRGMLAQTPGQRFETRIEVVTVTVAVTDAEGRLVTDLAQDEFELFEDGLPQTITQFTSERVPVSLAVLLDVSDSMVGLRLTDARQALDRFLFELLAREDEYALVVFNHQPTVAAPWTDDPAKVTPALDALRGLGRHGHLRRGERVDAAARQAAPPARRRGRDLGRSRTRPATSRCATCDRGCCAPTPSSTPSASTATTRARCARASTPTRCGRSPTTPAAIPKS